VKHYYHPQSRAATTDWMLRELDVPHEQILVDFPAGAQNAPEFRAINPMGKIPTLVDGDVVVTETAAICAYLADKFPDKGLAPPSGSLERGTYYRYLFFAGTTLEPLLTMTQLGAEGANPVSLGWGDLQRGLATVEALTPEKDWVLGPQFSAADVIYGGSLASFVDFDMIEPSPKVKAYTDRLKDRPAYKAANAPS